MARRRVLLIDRDSSYREALANLLSSEDCDVQVAEAEGASDRLAGFAGGLVVCGAGLLERDRDLAERIRGFGSRVILIGGSEAGTAAEDAPDALWLPKPLNMEELRRALRNS
jgi:DNA-binding response OmpR family regulator